MPALHGFDRASEKYGSMHLHRDEVVDDTSRSDGFKEDIRAFQAGAYFGLAVLYVTVVPFNVAAALAVFSLLATGMLQAVDVDLQATWAATTAGLGTGSLLFRPIVMQLFGCE